MNMENTLIQNGVHYYKDRSKGNVPKPIGITIVTGEACNGKCLHCDMWKIKNPKNLSNDEIVNLLADPLFSKLRMIDFTGGEPFLRSDYGNLLPSLKLDLLPDLRQVRTSTNALMPDKIYEDTIKWLKALDKRNIWLALSLSVDGWKERNAKLRGVAFEQIEETVELLKPLRHEHPFSLGIHSTFHSENWEDVINIAKWAVDNGLYLCANLVIDESDRFAHQKNKSNLRGSDYNHKALETICELIWKYQAHPLPENIYNLLWLKHGKRVAPCTGGWNLLFIKPNMDVCACPQTMESPMGNLRTESMKEIWFGETAESLRRRLYLSKKCESCNDTCFLHPSLVTEGFTHASFVMEGMKICYEPYTYSWFSQMMKTGLDSYV